MVAPWRDPQTLVFVARLIQVTAFFSVTTGLYLFTTGAASTQFTTDHKPTSTARTVPIVRSLSMVDGNCTCTNLFHHSAQLTCNKAREVQRHFAPLSHSYNTALAFAALFAFAEFVFFGRRSETPLHRLILRVLQAATLIYAAHQQVTLLLSVREFWSSSCSPSIDFANAGFAMGYAIYWRIGEAIFIGLATALVVGLLMLQRRIAGVVLLTAAALIASSAWTQESIHWFEHPTGAVSGLSNTFGKSLGLHQACTCKPFDCAANEHELAVVYWTMIPAVVLAACSLVVFGFDAWNDVDGIASRITPILAAIVGGLLVLPLKYFGEFMVSWGTPKSDAVQTCGATTGHFMDNSTWGWSFYRNLVLGAMAIFTGYLLCYMAAVIARQAAKVKTA
jgi:hypothetical protein